jgi:endoglucanase Acf2
MKGYGSTAGRGDSVPATPQGDRPSMPRNESAGGTTARSSETEPLLGEQLLIGNDEYEAEGTSAGVGGGAGGMGIDPRWLGTSDVSTISKVPSEYSARSSARKRPQHQDRGQNDSRIGMKINTSSEMDTLAYSCDNAEDSTLQTIEGDLTGSRAYLDVVDEESGSRKGGLLRRIFSSKGSDGNDDPPYVLVCLGLGVGIALCSFAAFFYVEYNRHYGAMSEDGITSLSPEGTWHGVPYARINRESFGDPVSNIMDVSLFHSSLLYGGHVPQESKTSAKSGTHDRIVDDDDGRRLTSNAPKPFLRVPFPTGAFWTNLVVLPQNHQKQSSRQAQAQYSYPIVAYPYAYQWSPLGKLQASYSASRRVVKENSVQDAFLPDITLGSVEDIHTRHVVKFDSLSVTLRFSTGEDKKAGGGNWETYIVQGSPYITAKYSGLSPELTALSDFKDIACPPTFDEAKSEQQPTAEDEQKHRRLASSSSSITATTATASKKLGICAVSDASTAHKKTITGVQFVATTKEGLVWLVFASEPITFEFNQGARHSIKSTEQYGGVIRVALVPPSPSVASSNSASIERTSTQSMDIDELASSPGVKRLIYHAGAYPVGGSVSWAFHSGARYPLALSKSDQHLRRLESTQKENNIGSVTFSFDTVHMSTASPNGDVDLLMLSLPHHAASITSAEKLLLHQEDFDLMYRSIKGRMVPVVGNSWSYQEELTLTGFGDEFLAANSAASQHPSIHESTAVSTLDQSIRDLILQTVESDLKINPPVVDNNGAYGFGKQIARIAQLAHIADVVDTANTQGGDSAGNKNKNHKNSTKASTDTTTSQDGSSTSHRAYAMLEKYLSMWLTGDGSEKHLAYDAQLGGILSSEGMKDVNSDFGNARYNDHHFHYGYALYASAILGRANPKFIAQYGPYVDALFYDVAHNTADVKSNADNDIFFPLSRHKSWFDGHSFATGLFPFANGKSQESSSEAVNCYYGAYLWAKVRWGGGGGTDGRKMVDFARLLLATEITGAKTYWHMTPSSSGGNSTDASVKASVIPKPYNPTFRENYMVGNLGMTDATCTTWFGTENIYVHLINFMPVTAITAELFDKAYVKGERSVLGSNDSVETAWRGYSISNEAIIDPNNAWTQALSLNSNQLDAGLSKSQVLFWVSTREGFSPETTAEVSIDIDGEAGNMDPTPANQINDGTSNSLASCSSHPKCVEENLLGSCCPTTVGVFLECCSKV